MGWILCPTLASCQEWQSLAQGVQGMESHLGFPVLVEVKQEQKKINWEFLDQKLMARHCCEAGLKQTLIFGFGECAAKNMVKQRVAQSHFGLAEGL